MYIYVYVSLVCVFINLFWHSILHTPSYSHSSRAKFRVSILHPIFFFVALVICVFSLPLCHHLQWKTHHSISFQHLHLILSPTSIFMADIRFHYLLSQYLSTWYFTFDSEIIYSLADKTQVYFFPISNKYIQT